ncbi:hypothetical protein [Mucilaginibacter sp. dw_454]|uniref:hypothetical protein n=1 Tax=Mucilaginibacter sp. dw_454 TaxID=2720079 RepID=UPI001BD2EB0D|nr:hypothetical protein [Mucilaginibacter sp. dw_454]
MSDAELRAKAGKTMVASAVAGLSGMLPEAWAVCDKRRQQAPAQVLPDLQGKGPERKEALCMT